MLFIFGRTTTHGGDVESQFGWERSPGEEVGERFETLGAASVFEAGEGAGIAEGVVEGVFAACSGSVGGHLHT